jgi:hypothetical protein
MDNAKWLHACDDVKLLLPGQYGTSKRTVSAINGSWHGRNLIIVFFMKELLTKSLIIAVIINAAHHHQPFFPKLSVL